ncbi:hypothetical protein BD626DRAFT_570647 [Schizophyllum amplum]|uniref:Small EDRK-rich factor-like N-terminal domain-containing protein n=1 Tax=Schizophyllum amplum TaxID=97359 RepID=A0A550C9E8_9AGAR|nr:hypothetical protein BD626DRAFT_570647 [Auriculariopsis ampla]
MGNGAKAQQKRERNAKNEPKGSKSQAKLVTTRAPALEEHSQNKHNLTMADCFPGQK